MYSVQRKKHLALKLKTLLKNAIWITNLIWFRAIYKVQESLIQSLFYNLFFTPIECSLQIPNDEVKLILH